MSITHGEVVPLAVHAQPVGVGSSSIFGPVAEELPLLLFAPSVPASLEVAPPEITTPEPLLPHSPPMNDPLP